MTKLLSHRFGFLFPIPFIAIGGVLIIIGIVSMPENLLGGIAIVIGGGFLTLSSKGTEVDILSKRYREYNSYWGIKKGKWNTFENYPFITVKASRSGYLLHGPVNSSRKMLTDYFDVCILSPDHRKKVVLLKFESKDEALESARKLSMALGLTLTRFNPPISEKTLKRRKK